MKLDKTDQHLAARFVDGELAATECAAFERRLEQEPGLAAAVAALRQQAHGRIFLSADIPSRYGFLTS